MTPVKRNDCKHLSQAVAQPAPVAVEEPPAEPELPLSAGEPPTAAIADETETAVEADAEDEDEDEDEFDEDDDDDDDDEDETDEADEEQSK